MEKRRTLNGGLALLVGGIITTVLGVGCASSLSMNPQESNKRYAAMAISKVDKFYSGKEAEEFKQLYKDIQNLPPEKFKEHLDKYNSNESWFLSQIGLTSDTELRKRFPWGEPEKLSEVDKVITEIVVEKIWDSIERATYNATNRSD